MLHTFSHMISPLATRYKFGRQGHDFAAEGGGSGTFSFGGVTVGNAGKEASVPYQR